MKSITPEECVAILKAEARKWMQRRAHAEANPEFYGDMPTPDVYELIADTWREAALVTRRVNYKAKHDDKT